jgi:hypothetical protein
VWAILQPLAAVRFASGKKVKVDAFAHRFISRIIWVKMISGIKRGVATSGANRVTQHRVEIDNAIGLARRSYPKIPGGPNPVLFR